MKINYPAVIVAGIVHWILGAVWYGIFSTKFIELIAWTPEQLKAVESQNHAKEYILAFGSSLVLVYILAHFIHYTKATMLPAGCKPRFGYGLVLSLRLSLRQLSSKAESLVFTY